MLEFKQMEFSPLRWSIETTRAALEAETRDVANKMIEVGGKNDIVVVDTLEWMSTGTLTIAGQGLSLTAAGVSKRANLLRHLAPALGISMRVTVFGATCVCRQQFFFASLLVASLNGRPT